MAEVGATGALNTRYIRGTGLIAREMDGALQYYLFDAHGDVLHRLDASGNMLKTYRYDAFGNEIDPETLDTNPFRYCGEYFDREIGTYYLRARNYDPRIGRFTTEDPARKDLNYYVYGRNNPIKFTDPTGMASRIPLNNYYDSQEYQDFVKGNKKGMAIVGLITGGIGFAASIILYILIFFTGLGSYSSYNDIYDHIYDDIYDDIEDSMDDGTI